ncbi:hypothetical protein LJB42_001539 [Komagataella kurtzmanii]|nr:hypothetical protein LJB42_001539 [Komagataella kurtzmanii]
MWGSIRLRVPLVFNQGRLFSSSLPSRNAPKTFGSIRKEFANQTPSMSSTSKQVEELKQQRRVPNEQVVKYVLHCSFTKNNTHLTLTEVVEDKNFLKNNEQLSSNEQALYYLQLPQRVKVSLSTGCVGFRKAQRGEYEAGYQTAAKMFETIETRGYLKNKPLEVVFKDFGKGRQGFVSALTGKEGTNIRGKISRLTDKTNLKFGGVRMPRPRRL